jgi:hypothetical protein
MTCTQTKSKRHLPAKLSAGLAIAAFFALGTFVASANAAHYGHGGHGGGYHGGYHGGYSGGYYAAPPVVYGSPYDDGPYYPPPVVYGPSIGIGLPGVNIGIR